MRNFFILLSLISCCVFSGNAQDQTLFRGAVSTLNIQTDSSTVNYAIYLPETYEVSKPSKVLFVLDPNGDGTRATRLFVSAAVNQDYIIVSNNEPMSADLDSLDVNAKMALNIMRDVYSKVALNKSQIYLAGMGSGAKTASALSYLLKNLSGILLIDDVYFAEQYIAQARTNNVIGIVGEASYNYYQMADFFQMMRSLNGYNELYTYSNSGEWPTASFLGILLNRLNHFQSEKARIEISDSIWEKNYKNDLMGLESLVSAKNYLTAYDLAIDLKRDYRGNVDLDLLKDFYRSLRKRAVYKMAKRANKSGDIEEILLLDDIGYFLDEDITLANFENLGYWDSRIKEFKDSALNSKRSSEQKVANRMLGYIDYKIEDFLTLNKVGLLPQRIFSNVLRTMLDTKDYQAYLNIISLSAQDEDDNTAYFYLEELLKQGYTDYDALYEIPETTVLKIKPIYNLLINKYLGKAKY